MKVEIYEVDSVEYNVDCNGYPSVGSHAVAVVKTVQITLDEGLAAEVDRAVAEHGTTRSAFTRDALRDALAKLRRLAREERHRAGYERHPVEPGEFDGWDDEQAWGD